MSTLALNAQSCTISVPFHGVDLYVVNHNGEPYTPMRPIIEGMGMDWASQFTKLKQRFSKGVVEITIPTAGGMQKMICLALRKLAAWLNTISPNKVRTEIRDRVIQYQEECDDVLYEYWTKGQVSNPRKPTSPSGRITAEQQVAIKELVISRGQALPRESQAKAMITMWSALKNHFGITYKEIRDDQFTEALSLVARLPLEGELLPRKAAPAQPAPLMPIFPVSADFDYITHVQNGVPQYIDIVPPGKTLMHPSDAVEMLKRGGVITIHYSELEALTAQRTIELVKTAKAEEAKWRKIHGQINHIL